MAIQAQPVNGAQNIHLQEQRDQDLAKLNVASLALQQAPVLKQIIPHVGELTLPVLSWKRQQKIHETQAETHPNDRIYAILTHPLTRMVIPVVVGAVMGIIIVQGARVSTTEQLDGLLTASIPDGALEKLKDAISTAGAVILLPQAANLHVVAKRSFQGIRNCWSRFRENTLSAAQALKLGACHAINFTCEAAQAYLVSLPIAREFTKSLDDVAEKTVLESMQQANGLNEVYRSFNASSTCPASL
jgi:hypothetical protein